MLIPLIRFAALVEKNFIVAVRRRPIGIIFQALILPLLIVLVVSYAKDFLTTSQVYGIGPVTPILSLEQALSRSPSTSVVAFSNNGFTQGEIAAVIGNLSTTIEKAGKQVQLFTNRTLLAAACVRPAKVASPCFAGIDFLSSPSEGIGGAWNYTLRTNGNTAFTTDVKRNDNPAQIYLMPLQHAVDSAIVSYASPGTSLPSVINQIQFTSISEAAREQNQTEDYLDLFSDFLGALIFLSLLPVAYRLSGFIAAERETGMSQLIDATLPGQSALANQILRLSSTYFSFVGFYLLGWLSVGIVLATVVFTRTSAAISIFDSLFTGLALASFSTFAAVFFRKAQLSGAVVVIVMVVLAFVPQLLAPRLQTQATVIALSLFFPSSNFVYFITSTARWESTSRPMNLLHSAPQSPWKVSGILLWVLLIVQIIVYPILAVVIERLLFATSSSAYHSDFDRTDSNLTIRLVGFGKTYVQNRLGRLFGRKREDVHAVQSLDLEAHKGTITMLLGPNGCGKSTTLDAIAALSTITTGTVEVDRSGGFGIAPQKNVAWDDLTVAEHIRLFSKLKLIDARNVKDETESLIQACDLGTKSNAKSKTLSGGQKRKLQLAIMFAGGSKVCCIDEVSTGLDPVSRRKIWDIILAARKDRTIIMTTHYLDEADWLADQIILMDKGVKQAQGSSAELKQRLGNGYVIHASAAASNLLPPTGLEILDRKINREGVVYRVATSAQAAHLLEWLDSVGIQDYKVEAPTIEQLFLNMTERRPSGSSTTDCEDVDVLAKQEKGRAMGLAKENSPLIAGRRVSILRQVSLLIRKRFLILRRSWFPYFVLLALPIIAAAVTPLVLQQYRRLTCPQSVTTSPSRVTSYYQSNFSTTYESGLVMGPRSQISVDDLSRITNLYISAYTRYPSQFPNVTSFLSKIHFVDSLTEFNDYISTNYSSLSPGGFFLSASPTMAWKGDTSNTYTSLLVQNMLDILQSPVDIATSYSAFPITAAPDTYDFAPLVFTGIFGLAFSCFPSFFALYPAAERLHNIRSMQYSNGVRIAALWTGYFCFDLLFIILVSVVTTVLLAVISPSWFGIAYLFVVILLFSMTSALLGYVVSLFARSPLAAWSITSLYQIVLYFAVFGAYISIDGHYVWQQLPDALGKVQWTVGLISPSAQLQRALYVGLGLYTLTCTGDYNPGSWNLYGGPIGYLIIQGVFLSGLLLWWENHFSMSWFRRTRKSTTKSDDTIEAAPVVNGSDSHSSHGLTIQNLTKSFGSNTAVDDISLHVRRGETYSLLGPNGGGKTTTISLIRGDLLPSTAESSIVVDGTSVLTERTTARSMIGVCPQFDSADLLTVTESLMFYARIRGVEDPAYNVNAVIADCGLEPWAKKLAQSLSGGTKRKLSLAQALVGNPSVLLLDEPSSSLDARSKRLLWDSLTQLSRDRATLLTTHSMEEAQTLATRVGIMSSRMLATGTVEEMCHDDVHHVHLVSKSSPHTSQEEIDRILGWLRENIEHAVVERENYCGQVRFSVAATNGFSIGGLFGLVEANKDALGVGFYSISRTTLDEVFVKVVRAERDAQGDS